MRLQADALDIAALGVVLSEYGSSRLLCAVCWLLALVCTTTILWLAYGVVPSVKDTAAKARQEIAREHAQSEAVVAYGLAVAMFARDYGEVQEHLDRYAETGLFSRAVVINPGKQIVASVDPMPGLAIGNTLPESIAATGRRVKLALRSEDYGELVVFAAPQRGEAAALETRIAALEVALRGLAWVGLALLACMTAYLIRLARRNAA